MCVKNESDCQCCVCKNTVIPYINACRCKRSARSVQGLVLVPLHVQSEVVGAGEAAAAHGTLERLSARVFAEVARELIRTSESPVTPFPCAPVWLLT